MPASEESGREPSDEESALVQFEALRKEFQVVLDGQQGVMRRLDHVESRVEACNEDLKKYLMDGLEKIYGDMRKIESRLAKVEAQRC